VTVPSSASRVTIALVAEKLAVFSKAARKSVSCWPIASSVHAVRVVASGPMVSSSPTNVTVPLNVLHPALPETPPSANVAVSSEPEWGS